MEFVYLILLACVFYLVGGQGCVYQAGCSCSETYTWCMNLGLTDIPVLSSSTASVNYLILDFNSISSVPAGRLPPNLNTLSIMRNPVASIDDAAFDDSINTLETVSFSSANFSKIPNAIGRLEKLREFHISNMRIVDWNTNVMQQLGSTLTSLTLEDCSITLWPDFFKYVKNLTILSLADNALSGIPDDGLETVADTVTTLDLQNNSLTFVPYAISKMSALQSLYVQYNHIANVSWLPSNSKLTLLALNNNKIQDADHLSQALRPYADSLQQLNTDSNRLTAFPAISFLTKIQNIYLSYNQISDPYSGSLPKNIYSVGLVFNKLPIIPKVLMTLKNATDLILSDNSLSQIRGLEFPPWATGAEFGYNLITELNDNSFPLNSSLRYMNLNNNPLHTVTIQAFQNVPLLDYLNFAYTSLSRLPLGLLSGLSLTTVDFSGCDQLVCTCQEKELINLIVSSELSVVLGNCGRTTIHDFYTTLAAGCSS